jgi:hypothetical protein
MSSTAPHTEAVYGHSHAETRETHVRVQVVPLCICVVASVGFVLCANNLPWFEGSDPSIPQFTAISASGHYVSPGSSAGLVPGTKSWGYLMMAWALLLALLALVAVADCVLRRHARRRSLRVLLLLVGVMSLILAVLVVPEFIANVQTDLVSFAGFSWGTVVGLGLAVLAALGAWFAWATLRFPHLWGIEPVAD